MPLDNVEVVRRVFKAFIARGEADAAADITEVWHIDARFHPALLAGGALEGNVYEGHEGVREFIARADEVWSKLMLEPREIRALDDTRVLVCNRLIAVGRISGVEVAQDNWLVFWVRDGKVAEGRVYLDEASALAATTVT